jgi:hypothetical protein
MTLTQFLKKYTQHISIGLVLIQIIFTVLWWFMTSGIRELKDEVIESLREIRVQTQKLSKHLEVPLAGGMTVRVGVNPREITENLLVVYSDNNIGLKAGDIVQLNNFTDNTFQASLKFIVQKSMVRPATDTSNASIFMSEIAAKKSDLRTSKRMVLSTSS